jgi:phosphoglycolate phosphatase
MPDDPARWIGPPIQHSFEQHCAQQGHGDPARLLRDYRARFDALGWRENSVYEGIPGALEQLLAGGHRLLLATAKPHVFAQRIVDHFGLSDWLDAVYGSELDSTRSDKTELLRHIIARESLDPARSIMVGDRKHDVLAACATGMAPVGVLWGYGDREELLVAGAQSLVVQPAGLPDAILALVAPQTCDMAW